jgi:hypothetical protein
MFFGSAKRQSDKTEAAKQALSISKDKVKTKLAEASDIGKRLKITVQETQKVSIEAVEKAKQHSLFADSPKLDNQVQDMIESWNESSTADQELASAGLIEMRPKKKIR